MDYTKVPIQPAATVVCTRSNENNELEVLLLRRNRKLKFASGFWVFPGGKIETEDGTKTLEAVESARLAAIREAEEEANLNLSNSELIHFMNWTTPFPSVKRFNTWFFITHLNKGEDIVTVDDSEIKDHLWTSPTKAISSLTTKEVKLLPPTFLTLVRLKHCNNFEDVKAEMKRSAPMIVTPKTGMKNGIFQSMYLGDAGYESHEIDTEGPRHRITGNMQEGTYQFEYHGCDHVFPVSGGYDW